MVQQFLSGAWVLACFMASLFVGLVEGDQALGSDSTVGSAWAQATQLATSASGKLSTYMDAPQSLLPMIGAGAAVGLTVICTLYCASRYFDREPYLFNNGKLGPLEAKSAYNKKCC